MDRAKYLFICFPLILLLKIISQQSLSDVWKVHAKKYEEKYKDEPLRAEQQLKREQFVIPQGANFYDVFGQLC
ncbi:hypothetical protein [Rickettsia fournieri]|uniref:hypothetical protein n=1 Tax=Rickettsia fournieri TaxID=1436798 RepID=UPI0018E93CFF|nr:hypothetical protein [Rickettsia fournieri]